MIRCNISWITWSLLVVTFLLISSILAFVSFSIRVAMSSLQSSNQTKNMISQLNQTDGQKCNHLEPMCCCSYSRKVRSRSALNLSISAWASSLACFNRRAFRLRASATWKYQFDVLIIEFNWQQWSPNKVTKWISPFLLLASRLSIIVEFLAFGWPLWCINECVTSYYILR